MADDPRPAPTLRDLMTTRVVVVSPDEPVADAAAAMIGQKVGSALIMQGRFLAGILTERDVLRAAASGSDLTQFPGVRVDDEGPGAGVPGYHGRGRHPAHAAARLPAPPGA